MRIYSHSLDRSRKEIRLLLIEPGLYEDRLRCKFKQAILSDENKPVYETISYVWGDASVRDFVYFEEYELEVPASAASALKRIRYFDRPRVVWIDAICINQQDIKERNSQVSLMRDIYSHTAVGLIWLDEDDGDIRDAVDMIHALFDEADRTTNGFINYCDSVRANGTWALSTIPSAVQLRKEPLLRFYSMAWFTRLW